jgi:Tol biopolymer transport system component
LRRVLSTKDIWVSWSPNGSWLAVCCGDGRVGAIHPNGTGYRRLADATFWTLGTPAWSPDSKRVAFSRGEPKSLFSDIWVAGLDGGEVRITDGEHINLSPVWRPHPRK